MKNTYMTDGITLHNADALSLYDRWTAPNGDYQTS